MNIMNLKYITIGMNGLKEKNIQKLYFHSLITL